LKDAEGFARLIKLAEPKFIEFKGYTWTGESQKRLQKGDMPQMPELEEFAEKIAKLTGYAIKHRDSISRVIVFVRDEETWKWNFDQIKEQNKRIAALDAAKIKVKVRG
jgi:tRNA wybutosine-synthesizing protein 1